MVSKDKEHFVSMPDYRRLLDACPDQEWRTLLALCRIGGLRNPSETLKVKWTDVNWELNRLLVHSPKTEHHVGKDSRIIPLFPELRKELERQFDQAREGAVFVIDHWRDVDKNLRTHFERIIFRAGLEKWDRLFHNLRGSRSNELFSEFPSHVASAWMGQNNKVALEHYLHPREEDFQKAIEEPSASDKEKPSKKSGSPSPASELEENVFC